MPWDSNFDSNTYCRIARSWEKRIAAAVDDVSGDIPIVAAVFVAAASSIVRTRNSNWCCCPATDSCRSLDTAFGIICNQVLLKCNYDHSIRKMSHLRAHLGGVKENTVYRVSRVFSLRGDETSQ